MLLQITIILVKLFVKAFNFFSDSGILYLKHDLCINDGIVNSLRKIFLNEKFIKP